MRTNRFAIFITALLLVGLALAITTTAADQHSGTWKMNPDKSKYSPGPGPKSTTVKVEADEKKIISTCQAPGFTPDKLKELYKQIRPGTY